MSRFQDIDSRLDSTFTALAEEERKLALKLKKMRDEEIFKQGGYSTFEDYCNSQLQEFGGYAHVKQLLDEVE